MLINEFVSKYEKTQKKEGFVSKHIIKTYMPYQEKIVQAKRIVDNSSFQDINGKSVFILNTPARYMLFIATIIESYTDIEWENNDLDSFDILGGFNLLEEKQITEVIVNTIGSDVERFKIVLDMVMDDALDANRSIIPFFENKFESIGLVLNAFESIFEREDIQEKITELINNKVE